MDLGRGFTGHPRQARIGFGATPYAINLSPHCRSRPELSGYVEEFGLEVFFVAGTARSRDMNSSIGVLVTPDGVNVFSI
jgi:hypothetical protein